MLRRILAIVSATIALAAGGAATAPTASAYLHVENAKAGCAQSMQVYADGWFANNGYGHTIVHTGGPWYHRASDSAVIVHAVEKGQSGGQAEVRCYMVGSDASMGTAFVSGYPQWTFLGFDNYPYTPCYWTVMGGYCLHDPGFS
jgi:hypothetical protein